MRRTRWRKSADGSSSDPPRVHPPPLPAPRDRLPRQRAEEEPLGRHGPGQDPDLPDLPEHRVQRARRQPADAGACAEAGGPVDLADRGAQVGAPVRPRGGQRHRRRQRAPGRAEARRAHRHHQLRQPTLAARSVPRRPLAIRPRHRRRVDQAQVLPRQAGRRARVGAGRGGAQLRDRLDQPHRHAGAQRAEGPVGPAVVHRPGAAPGPHVQRLRGALLPPGAQRRRLLRLAPYRVHPEPRSGAPEGLLTDDRPEGLVRPQGPDRQRRRGGAAAARAQAVQGPREGDVRSARRAAISRGVQRCSAHDEVPAARQRSSLP